MWQGSQGTQNVAVEAAVGRSNWTTMHLVPVKSRIRLAINEIIK